MTLRSLRTSNLEIWTLLGSVYLHIHSITQLCVNYAMHTIMQLQNIRIWNEMWFQGLCLWPGYWCQFKHFRNCWYLEIFMSNDQNGAKKKKKQKTFSKYQLYGWKHFVAERKLGVEWPGLSGQESYSKSNTHSVLLSWQNHKTWCR